MLREKERLVTSSEPWPTERLLLKEKPLTSMWPRRGALMAAGTPGRTDSLIMAWLRRLEDLLCSASTLAISTVNVSLTCLPNGLSHIWVRGPSCPSTSITTESTTIMPSCLPALTYPRLRARLPLKHSREWAWAVCNRNLWAWEDHLK